MTDESRLDWRPKVSALLPCYNAAKFIGPTLDCLAKQTWGNLEILIGDDCSTDTTPELVEKFAREHANVRILARERNLGWLKNCNDLMAQAAGELMFFAFHDDVLSNDYIEKLVGALQARPTAILAFGDVELFQLDGQSGVRRYERLDNAHTVFSRGRMIASHTSDWWVPNRGLFRARAFTRTGGIRPHAKGEYSADWTWLLHLSLLGDFVRVPEILCWKYYQPTSLSKSWPRDKAQKSALVRAGIAEIWHSKANLLVKIALSAVIATNSERGYIRTEMRRFRRRLRRLARR